MGSLSTSAQAGAAFGHRLLWACAVSILCVSFLAEMAGRLAAASQHTVADAVRERFGWNFYLVPFVAELLLDLLVLAAEIGGVCIAIRLLAGFGEQLWVVPVVLLPGPFSGSASSATSRRAPRSWGWSLSASCGP